MEPLCSEAGYFWTSVIDRQQLEKVLVSMSCFWAFQENSVRHCGTRYWTRWTFGLVPSDFNVYWSTPRSQLAMVWRNFSSVGWPRSSVTRYVEAFIRPVNPPKRSTLWHVHHVRDDLVNQLSVTRDSCFMFYGRGVKLPQNVFWFSRLRH